MFKKRSKAKQSISSTPSQRSSIDPEEDSDSKHDSLQGQASSARRDKLTIEDLRSRYGGQWESQASSPDNNVEYGLGSLSSHDHRSSAARGSQDPSTQDLRKDLEKVAIEMPDDDWEAEQLRKVGMSMSKPAPQDKGLEGIINRIKKRIEEMNQRTRELEDVVNDLESSL